MKNKIYFLVMIIFIIISNNLSNAQWFLVNLPTTNTLREVQLVTSTVGYAVGDSGTILKTTDGGTTWDLLSSGTTNDLMSLSFTDENTGTVVGSSGTILRTTNGGSVWTTQSSGTTDALLSVSFLDANNGIAGGIDWTFDILAILLKTSNGGATWFYQLNLAGYISAISFIDYNDAIATGNFTYCTILKSVDMGATWTTIDSLTSTFIYGISFINTDIGTSVGIGGFIAKTTNGGTNWTTQTSGTTEDLFSVSFTNLIYGTAVGEAGTILRTTNGGDDWINQSSGTTENLYSVSFVNENNGIVVGAHGAILRTDNGGVPVELVSFNSTILGDNIQSFGRQQLKPTTRASRFIVMGTRLHLLKGKEQQLKLKTILLLIKIFNPVFTITDSTNLTSMAHRKLLVS
jgi:photosystem II stability/assembly factor-like uncharacterized protein